jgi:ankyrin repeat protein
LAGAAAAPTRDSAARSSAAPSSAAASTAELAATQQAAGTDNKSSNALEEVVMTGSRITRDEVRRNSQFWRAAEKGDLANVQSLLSQGVLVNTRDSKGRTALLLAVQHRHPDIVNALLEKDADPNLPDNKGNTPLKAALDSRQTDLAETLRRHGAE